MSTLFSAWGVIPPYEGQVDAPHAFSPYQWVPERLVQTLGFSPERRALLGNLFEYRRRLRAFGVEGRRFEFEPIEGKSFSGGFPEDTDPETFAGFLKMKCDGTFVRHREIKLRTGQKPRWKWDLRLLQPILENK